MSSKNAVKERILVQEVESRTGPGVPSREEIRRRAFEIHIERGGIHRCDLDYSLQADKGLTQKLQR